MAQLDVDEFLARFQARADAVKARGVPPLENEARREFIAQAEKDFLDFSLIASANWSVEEGHLVLRIPTVGGS